MYTLQIKSAQAMRICLYLSSSYSVKEGIYLFDKNSGVEMSTFKHFTREIDVLGGETEMQNLGSTSTMVL